MSETLFPPFLKWGKCKEEKNPERKIQKIERLMFIVSRMKQLQTVETLLRIYENHEAFKKSKTYTEQKKKKSFGNDSINLFLHSQKKIFLKKYLEILL